MLARSHDSQAALDAAVTMLSEFSVREAPDCNGAHAGCGGCINSQIDGAKGQLRTIMSIECALLGAQITHHDNNIMCQCGRGDAGPLSAVGIPFQLLRQARGDNSCAFNVKKQRKSSSRRAKTSCVVTWRC
jgi:hypothetical protein